MTTDITTYSVNAERIFNQIAVNTGVNNLGDASSIRKIVEPILNELENIGAQLNIAAREMYIDTFAIDPTYRGKGLGKQLLQFAIEYYVVQQRKTLGLLVEENNAKAKKLYEHLGFKVVEDIIIFGKKMEHMQDYTILNLI